MFFRPGSASAGLLLAVTCLFPSLASPAVFAQQDQDPAVAKALSGLPPEVLEHVRLVPKTAPARPLDAQDPLAAAIILTGHMTGDEELKNRLRYECGLQALRQGRPATALDLASQISDYRAALLHLDVAEKEAASAPAHARELLQKAAALAPAAKPWQADLIRIRLCSVGGRLEMDPGTMASWSDAIQDDEGRLMAAIGRLALEAEKEGVFNFAALENLRHDFGMDKPLPGLLPMARRLFDRALAEDARLNAAMRRSLVEAALEILRRSNVVRSELLVEAATDFWKAGHEDLARHIFASGEKSMGAPYEESARLNARLVQLWKLRGRAGDLVPAIAKEEAKARSLEQMFRPFAYAWLAAAWDMAGHQEDAARLEAEAVQEAVTNVNPRTALLGAAHLCLAHAATGRPLAPQTQQAFAGLIHGGSNR